MVFSSTTFLFGFLPLVLLGYGLWRGLRWRNAFLLVASLLFYTWGEGFALGAMLLSIGVNYAIGRRVAQRRSWLVIGLVFNLGLLAFFKYANFLVDNLNQLLHLLDMEPVYLVKMHLPIGISFYTFQAISYLVDVYRKQVQPQNDPLKVALYISLFPQLIAGPIVRYADINEALEQRSSPLDEVSLGMQRFGIGLAKKVLIADTLAYVADHAFAIDPAGLSTGMAWLGIICYALQIYFDFSGYSDMAIGLGRVFGFRFAENFNYPYISTSIREFWRRWHISLSSWFRDYLYIPLGGNRKGPYRTYFNLLLVFFLCGLWHGANWAFILWGLWHGMFLVLERGGWGRLLGRLPKIIRHAYVLLVVLISWVCFRAEALEPALGYYQAMMGQSTEGYLRAASFLNLEFILTLVIGILLSCPVYRPIAAFFERSSRNWIWQIGLLLILAWTLLSVITSSYSPFIYLRF